MYGMKSKASIFALCTACVLGCNVPAAPKPEVARQPHPSWTLSAAEKRKLVSRAAKLKVGDSYETVIAVLGKPTEDRRLMPKGSSVSHGRLLRYQAVIWESGLVNEYHDEYLSVVLDTKNAIREISVRIILTE